MPIYYALIDAMAGREAEVERGLRKEQRVIGVVRCKEKNADFMVKFEAPGLAQVDDVMQTYVRPVAGIAGVEVILDWTNYSQATLDAKAKLG